MDNAETVNCIIGAFRRASQPSCAASPGLDRSRQKPLIKTGHHSFPFSRPDFINFGLFLHGLSSSSSSLLCLAKVHKQEATKSISRESPFNLTVHHSLAFFLAALSQWAGWWCIYIPDDPIKRTKRSHSLCSQHNEYFNNSNSKYETGVERIGSDAKQTSGVFCKKGRQGLKNWQWGARR